MVKLKRNICLTVQLILLVLFVFVANVSTTKEMATVSNNASNRVINLSTMALKLEEDLKNDLYSAKDTFTGDITGYGANCPMCSGHLACSSYYVKDGTTTYPDLEYGTVRIVAADASVPCGTIVKISNVTFTDEPFYAIVLDRGGAIKGTLFDLLFETEQDALIVGRQKNVQYEIQRLGW